MRAIAIDDRNRAEGDEEVVVESPGGDQIRGAVVPHEPKDDFGNRCNAIG